MQTTIESSARAVLREYPVKRAALFGSAARGNMRENSDIDMVVELLPNARGILFFGLQSDLAAAFGRKVDLLTFEALDREAVPSFRENVLRDMRVFYERED
jgi:predicted nucleotidyltransferase